MFRHTILLFLVVFISITVPNPVRGEVFTGGGLVDIPTGKVLQHGIFEAGTYLGFQQRMMDRSTTNLGDTVAVRLNFGLFDRVEVGLTHLWNEYGEEPSADRTANLKFQLLKEQETGAMPSIAIGIEKLGRDIVLWDSEAEEDESSSAFLAISKTFNLPRIHQFSGHIGIGTQRFAFSEGPIGLFVGLSKEFRPAFARGNITTSLEFDGAGVNIGVRYAASSGLQIALGAETLNDPDELRYLVSVSWTNEQILEQVDETRRLIKRATELVVETKRAISQKKTSDKATQTPPSQ
jgi:hypothetical protein